MAGKKNASGGRRPNSGRKTKAEELELVALLNKCWTKSDRESCLTKLAEKANNGDLEATKLLMAYTYGKPKETVAVEGSFEHSVIYVPAKAGSREEWERQQKVQGE